MHRLRAAAALTFIGFAAAFLVGCTAPSPTRLQLKPGDTRTGTVETSSELDMNMGMQMKMATTERIRLKMEVKEAAPEEGPITVAATFEDCSVSIAMNGQDMMSMPMVKSMVEPALKALQGKSFTFAVSPRGEILHIEGADEVRNAFSEAGDLPMGGAMLAQTFSDDQLKRYCAAFFSPLPLEPIDEASAWQSTQSIRGGFEADVTYDWKLKERNDSFITFAAATALTGSSPAASSESSELSGTGEATREVELATGWVVEGSESTNLSGKISFPAMPGMGQGGQLDVTGKVSVTAKTY